MKILVTGGSGLVGKAVQQITQNAPGGNEWEFVGSANYDLTKYEDVERMFQTTKPDAVVHLAANVGGLYKNLRDKVRMYEDNMMMGLAVISMANRYNVQRLFCMCSTCVFPDKIAYPITEESLHQGEPHPSNEGYAYAKRMLEVHCKLINEAHGREYVCLIPTNIYGPYDNFHLKDGHVLPALIHKCYLAKQSNEPFLVLGTGKPLRQFIFSNDLAHIIVWCVSHLKRSMFAGPSMSLICAPDPESEVPISLVAETVAGCFESTHLLRFDPSCADGQLRKTCSNAALRNLLPNFSFTPLEVGIRETVDWFTTNYATCRK